tara:strand:- start:1269 stop:1625 length:357 start_codon:yes stop_codon:yes gene_type:complete
MAVLSHNPHTYLNSYISQLRNTFLVSSIGIATIGMSKHFKIQKYIEFLAFIILIYGILYGLQTTYDFSTYINYLNTIDLSEPYSFQVNEWNRWTKFAYVYIFIIFVIAVILFIRKIKN